MKTTKMYILGAFTFAVLNTFSVLYLDALTTFFIGMAILSFLKKGE